MPSTKSHSDIIGYIPQNAHPTTEWSSMQNTFYRTHKVYQMHWANIDLSKYRVAASAYGGPIALLRDDRQLLEAGASPTLDSAIRVYSASGSNIGQIEYDGVHIAAFSWNSREELVCVQEDGGVRVFSLSGIHNPLTFSLGQEAKDSGVIDCRFWDQGLVAMTADLRFIYVNDVSEPKPKLLAETHGLNSPPLSWTVVPPHLTLSHHVEILLATGSTVLTVDAVGVQDQLLENGPFVGISVSPNGRLIALCSERGNRIQVVSADFQKSFSETYREGESEVPCDIAWCGSDAVVASYTNEVLLVGPFGDTLAFGHEERVRLVQELDGVRMFNSREHWFLSRVSEECRSVFQIGSTSPAALLYDAHENLRAHSSRADDIVRSIRDDLAVAVDACIAAAGDEPSIEYQQALIRAASFGKSFLSVYNGDKLVEMCKRLRIVNCFVAPDVGIPVSVLEFQSLPFEEWVARLLNRNMHQLALHVCKYIDEPADQVFVHWACAKIRASPAADDDALYRVLMAKLEGIPGVSFVEIAEVANENGYARLAIKLLSHEPRAANQVPLLIAMGQDDAAMNEAIRSGNADLVYFVIFHLFKTLPLGDFFHVVGRNRVAARLFEKYCTDMGAPVLEDYYFQDDAFASSAHLILIDNLNERDTVKLIANLKVAAKFFHRDKSCVLETRTTELQIKLLQTQSMLDREMPPSSEDSTMFVGLTVNETVAQCIKRGNYTRANKVRSEFKVPERRFYWIKLRALVKRRDWAELARLANAKKSPIGYRPFVDECVAALQYQEAAKYIPRCESEMRAELYVKIGFYHEAAQHAVSVKDLQALRRIQALTTDTSLQSDIAMQIEQLSVS